MPTPTENEKDTLHYPWNSPIEQGILELLFDVSDQEKRYMTVKELARELSCSTGYVKKCLTKLAARRKVFCPRQSGRWFFNTDHAQALWEAEQQKWKELKAKQIPKRLKVDGEWVTGFDSDGLYRADGYLFTGETTHSGDFIDGVKVQDARFIP